LISIKKKKKKRNPRETTTRKQGILTVLPAISAGMASRRISSAGKFQLDGEKKKWILGTTKMGLAIGSASDMIVVIFLCHFELTEPKQ
jgi:hypothetical protein